jgi:hypothetical protein
MRKKFYDIQNSSADDEIIPLEFKSIKNKFIQTKQWEIKAILIKKQFKIRLNN